MTHKRCHETSNEAGNQTKMRLANRERIAMSNIFYIIGVIVVIIVVLKVLGLY
jgi:hypothetical protein